MTREELLKQSAPFDVVEKRRKKRVTVRGFAQNDPLGVGGGLMPDIPVVYFKGKNDSPGGGGWVTVEGLLNHYEIA